MLGRITRICCEVVALTALALFLLAGVASWRLSQGPVPLNFLSSHIENALNDPASPVRVAVDGTNLAWAGWDRTLDIRVLGVKVSGADGTVIARIPEMSVSFSLPALLRGTVAPTNLDLIEPRLKLVRNASGKLAMTLEETNDLPADTIGGVIAALSAPKQKKGVLRYLRQFSILDAKLEVDDRVTGLKWGVPQADLVVIREEKQIRASLFADLDAAGRASRLIAKASLESGAEEALIDFSIENFPLDRLSTALPQLKVLKSAQIALNGDIAARVSLDGIIQDAKFEISGGVGHIEKGKLWPSNIPVKNLKLRAKLENVPASLEIESFSVNVGGPTISLNGSIIAVDDGMSIDARVAATTVPISKLKNYWPIGIGKVARKWVTENMLRGVVENVAASFSLRMPDLKHTATVVDSFSGKLRLRNSVIRFNENFPNLEKVEATAVFSKGRFVASISSGLLSGLNLVSGRVKLLDLDSDKEFADITTKVSGPLRTALSIVDNEPLKLVSKFGIDAKTVRGWSSSTLQFRFPLSALLRLSDVDVTADSRVINAVLPKNPLGKPIESGNFSLKLDTNGLVLDGSATVTGTPLKLNWEERFDQDRKFVRRYHVAGHLDEKAQVEILKLPDLSPFVSGPLGLELALVERNTGRKEIAAKVSLKDATLGLSSLNWTKKPGVDGVAWLSIFVEPSGATRIQNFDVQTGELRGMGNAQFDAEGNFVQAAVQKFSLGRSEFDGSVTTLSDGSLDVVLNGKSLDAVHLFSREVSEHDTNLPRMTLKAKIDTVWFDKDVPITAVESSMTHDGIDWDQISITGLVGENQPFAFDLETTPNGKQFNVRAGNAGKILAGLDLVDDIRGGVLDVKATQKKGTKNAWNGRVAISDFTVVRASILARVLTLASLSGIVNTLTGKGIRFARLNIPFSYSDGNANIRNARAVGSELGITADGALDLDKKSAALNGTIVPAYSINSALGNIPIIGQIFTGKKGSGVFAATYGISGELAKPKITVNPLAALAPGFLRDLIGILGGGTKRKEPSAGKLKKK